MSTISIGICDVGRGRVWHRRRNPDQVLSFGFLLWAAVHGRFITAAAGVGVPGRIGPDVTRGWPAIKAGPAGTARPGAPGWCPLRTRLWLSAPVRLAVRSGR